GEAQDRLEEPRIQRPPPCDAGGVGCRIKDESARSGQTGAWAHSFTTNQERKMTVAPQRRSTRRKMRHCSRCPQSDSHKSTEAAIFRGALRLNATFPVPSVDGHPASDNRQRGV